ncbi:MAG TPA: biopolymer transporter ExbD [Syntrophorhabdales bacterium]|nr:biopolymer transporter ExbD [Syntrophorhabdales bacterium]
MTPAGRQRGPLSEINVVPLVDIMLVLLIIFMIAAPMMQHGMSIDLPKVTTKPLPSKEDVQVLTITKDKTVILNEKRLEASDLKAAIQLLFTNKPDKEIFLRADSRVPYGFVVSCMALIREAGVDKINIVTKNIDEK